MTWIPIRSKTMTGMVGEMTQDDPRNTPFYKERAERLKLFDNTLKTCRLNQLSVSLDHFEEVLTIAYDLLEAAMNNEVQNKLSALMKKAIALVEGINAEKT